MRKLLKNQGMAPTELVADRLRAYGAAARELGLGDEHIQGKRKNYQAEGSHVPIRLRERKMLGFRSPGSAQRFLATHPRRQHLRHLLPSDLRCFPSPIPSRRLPRLARGCRIGSLTGSVALIPVRVLALLYRFGPSRAPANWRWVTPGSLTAATLWLASSVAFSLYVAKFATYNQTYGTLGGVVILLVWLYISLVILLGPSSTLRRSCRRADTTTGPPMPMGHRQAYVADHTPEQRRR